MNAIQKILDAFDDAKACCELGLWEHSKALDRFSIDFWDIIDELPDDERENNLIELYEELKIRIMRS